MTKGFNFEKIKEIDTNWEAFKSIYDQPVFTEEQKWKLETNLVNFESWLVNKITDNNVLGKP